MRGYEALRSGAASALLARSTLRLSGSDTFDFLHRMSTNDLRSLSDGESRRTVFVSEKGRVIDLATVHNVRGDALILGSRGAGRTLADWLARFVIADDVKISGVSEEVPIRALYGPSAEVIVRDLFPGGSEGEPRALREDLGGIPGYLVVGTGEGVIPGSRPPADGIADLDDAAAEAARIEECVPAMGRELGPWVNALEAGLKRFISFSKGCYIGQEVIARLDTYRKLQAVLALFVIDDFAGAALAPGPLRCAGTDAGRITSTAWSPRHHSWIGLGFRRIRIDASPMEFTPGGTGAGMPCRILGGTLPGYEEYETGT